MTDKIIEKIKLDNWYGYSILLGLAMVYFSSLKDIDFISRDKLFGLGLGLIIWGFSMLKAENKSDVVNMQNGFVHTEIKIKHNSVTRSLFWFGFLLSIYFGFFLLYEIIF